MFTVKHKFNAVRCEKDGLRYDSKKEMRYAQDLEMLKRSGEVLFYLRQIPFDLPGGSKHRLDFMEFHTDGTVKFTEVKGFDTAIGKLKRKQVEDLYPIKIKVV